MKLIRSTLAGLAVAGMTLLPAAPTLAAPTETTRAGFTSVVLAPEFLGALKTLGVKPDTIGPGRLQSTSRRTSATFPITTGAVDLSAVQGEIDHAGGLSLKAGSTRVELSAFLIDLNPARPVLTGLAVVNDDYVGRIPLFDLGLASARINASNDFLTVRGVAVTLADEAAAALNSIFNVTAFAKGVAIGTATVRAILDGGGHYNGDDDRHD